MEWIFISPHLDDVALSCGGLVWEMAHAGKKVAIWTICAGEPPSKTFSLFTETLHARWHTGSGAVEQRRAEDIVSCQSLGVSFKHLLIPDCIYRQHPIDRSYLYTSEQDIFGDLHPSENELIESLSVQIQMVLPGEVCLIIPLTLGRHIDHQMTRTVMEKLKLPLWYYADYPYVLNDWKQDDPRTSSFKEILLPISNAGVAGWIEAISAHASQVSTFWENPEKMNNAIFSYEKQVGGIRLWRPHNYSNLLAFQDYMC
jgi:LmbE family N-acetylglucosaminyl deacetylase